MKHNENEILDIAIQVMQDIGWDFDTTEKIEPWFTSKEKQIKGASSARNHPRYEEYIATFISYWTVGFDFPKEAEIDHNSMFLSIDDDTGEAYSLRHKQAGFKIEKNNEGKYIIINDWVQGQGDH